MLFVSRRTVAPGHTCTTTRTRMAWTAGGDYTSGRRTRGPVSRLRRPGLASCARGGGRSHVLYGRMFTNCFSIKVTGEAALFPLTAMCNHSCLPNAG